MFRLLLQLILCASLIIDKRTVQRPATQANFGFLIPIGNMLTKIKNSVETVQYTVGLTLMILGFYSSLTVLGKLEKNLEFSRSFSYKPRIHRYKRRPDHPQF